jgi:REP element-mobilizing transposase RayT
MGRIKRFFQDWMVYHVIVRCNNKQMLLRKPETKLLFIETFGKYQERLGLKIYGFVVMDNHVHLLIQIQGSKNLSVLMQKALLSFGKRYRKDVPYVGHFWQGRFIAKSIISDEGLKEVIGYVHNNPVKAKMVERAKDYAYSSARQYEALANEAVEGLIKVTVYGDTSSGSFELIKV